jgi:hypothetical protein
MIANKECYERGCACYDSRVDGEGIKVVVEREWVGLTRDEILDVRWHNKSSYKFARVLEVKLKEKNSDNRN